MTTTWAYIYEHPGADAKLDRTELARGGQRSIMVPVADPADAPDVARRLVEDDGVALIELCGGFPLAAAARVADEVGDLVPVGHVTFAVDAVGLAAGYSASFEAEQAAT